MLIRHCKLLFIRGGGMFQSYTDLVECEFDTLNSVDEALQILTNAVTRWVEETQEGKDAYRASVEDLNIGDLASEVNSSTLKEWDVNNIHFHRYHAEGEVVPYDKHLYNGG